MDLLALRNAVTSLQSSLDSWSNWLLFFTLLVVVGLLVEYHDEFLRFFGRRHGLPKGWPIVVGGILVTVGVAGELFTEFKASRVETNLRLDNGKIVLALDRLAGNAKVSADKAADAAKRADVLSSSAALQISALDKEARNAERRAIQFKKQEVRLEHELEWRRLDLKQAGIICKEIGPFPGSLSVVTLSGNPEAFRYAEDFAQALRSKKCKWKVAGPSTILELGKAPPEQGIFIDVRDAHAAGAGILQHALRDAGIVAPGRIDKHVAPGAVELFVGTKPMPSANQTAQNPKGR